jgi:hypothetical protein
VEVFCTEGICRNNVGGWQQRAIPAPNDRKDFSYYAAKDEAMADEASIGLMIWDGESLGTLLNVFRLIRQNKTAVMYVVPEKRFSNLRSKTAWDKFISHYPTRLRERIEQIAVSHTIESQAPKQASLF